MINIYPKQKPNNGSTRSTRVRVSARVDKDTMVLRRQDSGTELGVK